MILWFKYNSTKLPWNSFYRHTSISDSSSFFNIGGGMKINFYQSFAGFPLFFSYTKLYKGKWKAWPAHSPNHAHYYQYWCFVFHWVSHPNTRLLLKLVNIFLFLFMTGFSANELLARFLKETLKLTPTHRHTRCECAPRPRTLQGGSEEPLIIDFPSYFFCLLQWISYPEHIACYGLHKHTYSTCKTMHMCV